MALEFTFLSIGIITLFIGSEALVRGASEIALTLSIRPILVGLTVVAFATSSPELMVSLTAVLQGSHGISVGNILGSNVINIGLVLGLAAMARPISIHKKILKRELPLVFSVTLLFWILSLDGHLSRLDGAILFTMLIFYIVISIMKEISTRPSAAQKSKEAVSTLSLTKQYLIPGVKIVVGLFCLGQGANWIVESALSIARDFNLNEIFIGITVVALGTSLPELATSVVAMVKNESDISLGNVIGSNLFNISMVMGIIALFTPIHIDSKLHCFEFPYMVALTGILWLTAAFHQQINRLYGFLFIASVAIYLVGAYLPIACLD